MGYFEEQFHHDIIFPQGRNCSLYQVRFADFSRITQHHGQAWLITLLGKVLMCLTQCFGTASSRQLLFFFPLNPEEKQTTRPTSRKNSLSPLPLDTSYCMETNAKGGWLPWLPGTGQRQQPGTEAQEKAVNINSVRRHIDVQSEGQAP